MAWCLTLNVGLVAVLANNLERPVLQVLLDGWIVHFPTDEPLRIKDSVVWIHCRLVLGCIAYQSL